jgi:hypothetical protein
MNKFISVSVLLISFFLLINTGYSQDLEIFVHRTFIDSTVGSEMVFDFEIINISSAEQTIFEVRTLNDLPSEWTSSLCFGINCFSPFLDSVATTTDFGNTPPLNPGDTLKTSLHVTAVNNEGTANVQIQVGTFRNPTVRTTLDFTATTLPNSVDDNNSLLKEYYLGQNYPNPFNPTTKINFGLKKAGNVEITLYNILGNKVATMLSDFKSAGNHTISFDGANLSSGAYLYKIVSNGFVQTRKMLLIK